MKKLKIAIIGLQHLHPRSYMEHFKFVDAADIVAVAEEREDLRTAFAGDYNLNAYKSLQDLIQHETIDLAAIFLPHNDCPAAALAAIEKKVHVMIEKPMTADSGSAEKIVEAAGKHGVFVTTPYAWRYHPVVKDIKKLIDDGVPGQIIGCEGRCAAGRLQRYIDGNSGWMLDASKSGGGPMYNLGVHWIDLVSWLIDQRAVSALAKNVKVNQEYNIEDNSFAMLTYENGPVLSLDISYTVPESFPHGRDLYISIRGTKGVISWAPAFEGESDELFICSDHESFRAAPRQKRNYEIQSSGGYAGIMGLEYLQDITHSILKNTPPFITGEDGIYALKVAEAIYQSAESGRSVAVNYK